MKVKLDPQNNSLSNIVLSINETKIVEIEAIGFPDILSVSKYIDVYSSLDRRIGLFFIEIINNFAESSITVSKVLCNECIITNNSSTLDLIEKNINGCLQIDTIDSRIKFFIPEKIICNKD